MFCSLSMLISLLSRWKTCWYKDPRSWHMCVQHLNTNWALLMPHLTEAYLRWKYPSTTQAERPLHEDPVCVSDDAIHPSNNPAPGNLPPAPEVGGYDFDIDILDVYSLSTHACIPRSSDSLSTSVDLIS